MAIEIDAVDRDVRITYGPRKAITYRLRPRTSPLEGLSSWQEQASTLIEGVRRATIRIASPSASTAQSASGPKLIDSTTLTHPAQASRPAHEQPRLLVVVRLSTSNLAIALGKDLSYRVGRFRGSHDGLEALWVALGALPLYRFLEPFLMVHEVERRLALFVLRINRSAPRIEVRNDIG